MTAPDDWRALQSIKVSIAAVGLPPEVHEDRHFFISVSEFAAYVKGRKTLRMEYFYREQRKRHRILMGSDSLADTPFGGK
jgi:deoxyribodipyrimidine photolyase-related protein